MPYLLPKYWIPFLYPIENGFLFQGFTATSDPLKRHNYTLNISFDTLTQKTGGGINYVYSMDFAEMGTTSFINNEPILGSMSTLTNKYSSLYGRFYIPGLSYKWRGFLSGQFIKTDQPSRPAIERTGGSIGISYSNLFQQGRSTTSPGGYQWSLDHTEYSSEGLRENSYGRTAGSLAYNGSHFLPESQTFIIQSRAAFAPKLTNLLIADRTIGGNYLANLINSSFLMRGYPSGDFLGREIVNFNLEYDFPIAEIFAGRGLFPIFLRQLRNTVFVDYVGIDGFFVKGKTQTFERVTLGRGFWGTGTEFKLSTTTGYHIPINFILGLYYGLDKEARGGLTPFIGMDLSGMDLSGKK